MKVVSWKRPFAIIELSEDELYVIENCLGSVTDLVGEKEIEYHAGANINTVETLAAAFTKLKYEMYGKNPPSAKLEATPLQNDD